jgi:hypothetical protein
MQKKKSRKPTGPNNPHDKIARHFLQYPDVAVGLVHYSVPETMIGRIDMHSLAPGKESFVDHHLAAHILDICYTGCLKDGTNLRISFLFEHKSSRSGSSVYFQLRRYIVQVNQMEMQQGLKPSMVIPILLYHGTFPFRKESLSDLFPGYSEEFAPVIPDFDYYVVDINEISEESLGNLQSALLLNFLRVLIGGINPDKIAYIWDNFLIFVSEMPNPGQTLDLLQAVMAYFQRVSPEFKQTYQDMGYQYEYVTPEELQVKAFFDNYVIPRVKKLQEEERERLREESIKEGLREGINAGRNEGLERTIITFMKNAPHYSDSDLAVLFEVAPEFVHRLREKMKS